LFIFLIAFGNVITISSNVNSVRKYTKRTPGIKEKAKKIVDTMAKGSKNKWVRLIEGLASGFTGVEEIGQKLFTCIQNLGKVVTGDDSKPEPEDEKTVNPKEEPTSKIKKVITVAGWITKGLCLIKGNIFDAIKKILTKKRKNNRRFSK